MTQTNRSDVFITSRTIAPQPALVKSTLGLVVLFSIGVFIWNAVAETNWLGKLFGFRGIVVVAMGTGLFAALAFIYRYLRKNEFIYRATLACALLPLFSLTANLMTFLGAGLQMPLVDSQLAALDRMLGLDWPAFAHWSASKPWICAHGFNIYAAWFALVPPILIFESLWMKRPDRLEKVVAFLVVTGIMTVIIASVFPASSVFAYHGIPLEMSARLGTENSADYARIYDAMRTGGDVSLVDVRHGTVTFPSFHAVVAIMGMLYSRHSRIFFVIMCTGGGVMLFFTPVMGAHYFVDLLGGLMVALIGRAIVEGLAATGQVARSGSDLQ